MAQKEGKNAPSSKREAARNILVLPISEVRPYEKNPRKNSGAVKYVKESIRQFGFKVPIVIDSNRVIVCGHTRLLAAKSLGMTEVPCIMADDLTDDQIKAFRLADNKVGEFSEWDMDLLGDELDAIADASDIDMEALGFDLSETEEETEIVEEEVPEEVEPVCKAGELWQLGEHRLLCGDSTKREDVLRLMGEERADVWLTDPPYNVAYEGGTSEKLTIKNDSMDDEKFRAFLLDAFTAAVEVMKPGAAFYIWHAEREGFNFRYAVKNTDLLLKQCLIWNKNQLVMGRQDFQWKHDPCLYGWKDGGSHHWYSDRKQTTVLNFDKPLRNADHPTMKPVPLFGYQIQCSSKEGDIILDTFGGSGTTIVASEQLKRKARCMELDPHYCDVIIARWEKLTGQKAVKVEG